MGGRDWLARVAPGESLPAPDRIEALDRVVVLGAGPTGLTCALELARRGVPVTVLEKLPGLSDQSRASTFHPATLELLADLGLAEEVVAAGLVAPESQFRDRRGGPVATFDLGVLAGECRFPFRVQLEQSKYTPMALAALASVGTGPDGRPLAEVRFSHRGHVAVPEGDRVRLLTGTEDGLVEIVTPWLVVADGAHSAVRDSIGIALEGEVYPERFLVVSVGNELTEHLDDLAHVNYVADPDEWLVLLRTPDHWRMLFPVPGVGEQVPSGDGVPSGERVLSDEEVLSDEQVLARLDGVVALGPAWQVLDRSLYVVSRRVASTMRRGRVLLAGDAAHQNSPLGGMGMNSGIQDAVSLGRRLAEVWQGAADAALDEYDRRRRGVATSLVQADSHANWLALREPDPGRRAELRSELVAIAADPVLHAERMRRAAMLDAVRTGL